MDGGSERGASRAAGMAAVTLAATAFSWGFVIVKVLGLPPATVASWRLLIGGAVLGAAALALRLPWPRRRGAMVGAGVCFGLHQLLYIGATLHTSIAIVTLLGAMQPLAVSLASRKTVGEVVPRALFGWAAVALLGVGVVVHANLGDPSRSLLGDTLAVLNVVAFTAFFLFSKRARMEGAHTVTLTAGVFAAALLVVAPLLLLEAPRTPAVGWKWGLVALLALVPGNGHLLLNWAHRRITAALASLVLTAVPLLASIWAHLVLGEPYGLSHVVGMLLVAAAVEGARRAEARTGRDVVGTVSD